MELLFRLANPRKSIDKGEFNRHAVNHSIFRDRIIKSKRSDLFSVSKFRASYIRKNMSKELVDRMEDELKTPRKLSKRREFNRADLDLNTNSSVEISNANLRSD